MFSNLKYQKVLSIGVLYGIPETNKRNKIDRFFLQILIYNQTDIPESSMNGVNVPPGYSMDIPYKMQHVRFF